MEPFKSQDCTFLIQYFWSTFNYKMFSVVFILKDGHQKCLSDVDDIGYQHYKCLWRGLWEAIPGRICRILQSKNYITGFSKLPSSVAESPHFRLFDHLHVSLWGESIGSSSFINTFLKKSMLLLLSCFLPPMYMYMNEVEEIVSHTCISWRSGNQCVVEIYIDPSCVQVMILNIFCLISFWTVRRSKVPCRKQCISIYSEGL